jgi:tetratricopeptide (TPR) repeat protein
LLDHEENYTAEATLLVDPDWRCVYYDAVATVFVSRRRRDLEAMFPSVDFAARHFHDRAWLTGPPQPSWLGECKGLYRVGEAVAQRPGSSWSLRLSLLLLASDRLLQTLATDPSTAAGWTLLGNAVWSMAPDLTVATPGPDESWDPARGILAAQATACYRRALEQNPEQTGALYSLWRSFQARGMSDAEQSTAAVMRRLWAAGPARNRDIVGPGEDEPGTGWDREGLSRAVAEHLRRGRAEAAARLFAAAEDRGIVPPWTTCDRAAVALLHLGRPAEARRIWERAADPPSPALRLTRVATAALAALDFATAEQTYRAALQLDAAQGEAWFGLALLHTQRGEATAARAAAQRGLLARAGSPAQTAFLRELARLAARFASDR